MATESGYADVNGLHMYFETYGDGTPLVLLHGGLLSIDLNFATLIPTLAKKHRVIGVEMQGHGRTADIDRPITPAALASDIVGLLDHLGIDRAHVLGHSMGGAVTMELAVSHPDRVLSVVPISVSVRPDGMHPDLSDPWIAAGDSPQHDAHAGDAATGPVASDPRRLPGLVGRLRRSVGEQQVERPAGVLEDLRGGRALRIVACTGNLAGGVVQSVQRAAKVRAGRCGVIVGERVAPRLSILGELGPAGVGEGDELAPGVRDDGDAAFVLELVDRGVDGAGTRRPRRSSALADRLHQLVAVHGLLGEEQ